MGWLKGQTTMTVQAYRFPKDKFTPAQARAWLSDNDVTDYTFEPAAEERRRESMGLTLESLQSRHSEIIQEMGRRNAARDAARVKKILELCQELLSSEDEPDEKRAIEALREAESTLVWLREQVAVKEESGHQYPIEAYAYTPNAHVPGSWTLRLWQDSDQKVTKSQLARVAAELSPGGLNGKKAQIPESALPAVKRKIRAAYRQLKIDEEDIPRWVKESETRELIQSFVPLTEATFDKGRAKVIVITPGFNAFQDRYYPPEVLRRDYGIFEGQKMYADHPTEAEDRERPERSIRDWVATLSDVMVDESGVVTGVAEIVEPWLMQKLASLRDKAMLSEMGVSINAVGSASKGTIDGKETLIIERLVSCRSVDFVTEPGAGGVVTLYESDKRHDIDLVDLSALRDKRPDLVKALESEVRAQITKEVKRIMEVEEKVRDLEGQIATLTTERDNLKETAERAERDKVKAEAQATIKEAVEKAELPNAAKERLLERFKEAEIAEGIEEAIKAEADYIARLSESGKVRGLGATQADAETGREALKESFKMLHPEWTPGQVETAVARR